MAAGRIPVAFEGYRYTYSHAGDSNAFDVREVNEAARAAGAELLVMSDEGRYDEGQLDLLPQYETVFGIGEGGGRGPSAGLLWMDFEHMTFDAPPQIVGHSRHSQPTREARVVCQNVIRENLESRGGEAVLIEGENELTAVTRTPEGPTLTEL